MTKWITLVLTPIALAASVCAREEPSGTGPRSDTISVVVTAGLVGHLEPCGCSPDQRGGVSRAAQAIEAIRQEGHPVVLVDGGDRFFPGTASSDPLVSNQQQLEALAMADATRAMRFDALVLGARDVAGAPSLVGQRELPPVLDTGEVAIPGTKPWQLVDAGGHKLGLLAIGSGPDSAKTLAARAAAAKEAGAERLLLFAYRTFQEAKALIGPAKGAGIEFIVATKAEVPETHESGAIADDTPALFTVAARGEAVLRIDLGLAGPRAGPIAKVPGGAEREETLAALQQRIDLLRAEVKESNPQDPVARQKTEKLLEIEERRAKLAASAPPAMPRDRNVFTYAFIPMSPKLPKSAPVQAIVDRFHADSAKQNLEYVKAHPRECPRAAPGKPSFAGDQACVDCHEDAYTFWKTTPHAHAYRSLVDKNRQYDVACISCHVVGYEQPGGACSIAAVKGRENVQCESCHGPSSIHAEEGTKGTAIAAVPVATCKRCHDPENSPHFNDKTYRPQILGPGHGAPLADQAGKK